MTLNAPNSQEIHIWLCEAEKIREPLLLQRYRSWLNPEEIQKMERYRFEKHQHQYLITRALIRGLLSQYQANIRPEAWEFEKNQWGKPSLINEQNPDNWVFNLSHTEGMIVCALSADLELGIDVEDITREGETVKIADRYFSNIEHQDLLALGEDEQDNRFFDLWTLKESYIKACGKGLAIPLDEFSFRFEPLSNEETSIQFHTDPKRQDQSELWNFWNWQIKAQPEAQERHRLSLGIKDKDNKHALPKLIVKRCVPLLSQNNADQLLKLRAKSV